MGRIFTLGVNHSEEGMQALVFSSGLIVTLASKCGTLVGRHTEVSCEEVTDVVEEFVRMTPFS